MIYKYLQILIHPYFTSYPILLRIEMYSQLIFYNLEMFFPEFFFLRCHLLGVISSDYLIERLHCTSNCSVISWRVPQPFLRSDNLLKQFTDQQFTCVYWFIIKIQMNSQMKRYIGRDQEDPKHRSFYLHKGGYASLSPIISELVQNGSILFNKILSCFSKTRDQNSQVIQLKHAQSREIYLQSHPVPKSPSHP